MFSAKNRVRFLLGLSGATAGTPALAEALPAPGGPSETVTVTERRSELAVLPDRILDTPQTVDVVPAQVIREQGVNNLQDALKNVPGITLNAGEGGAHGDLVNLRGFAANDDYFLDGLRDTGLYTRDAFDYDSIEVLKGPSSTLFGRGTTGGAINQVTKSPTLYPIDNFSLTGGTNGEARGTADINTLLGDDSAFRLNLMADRSNQAGRPFVRNQRWGVAPAIAFGLGTNTVWTLKYLHQQQDDVPDGGIPFVFGKPAPVSHNAFFGLPSDDRFKTDVEIATATVSHQFGDDLSLRQSLRYGSYWFDARETNPHFGSANCFVTAPFTSAPLCAGTANPVPATAVNPLFPVVGTPLDQVLVTRDRPSSKGTIQTMMSETELSADFGLGPTRHHLTMGVELDKENASITRFANQMSQIPATPLLAPDPYETFPGTQTQVTSHPVTKTATDSLFAVDTIALTPQWSLLTALRFDHFGATFDQPLGRAAHFTHNDNIVSPRVALTYKPSETASLYVSWGTSFNPSAESLTLAAGNQGLSPERDHSFEVGAKVEVLDGMLALTAAAFNTVMENARISDPLNPGLQELAGQERVNGIELGAQGRLTENWELIAGYTYLAPRALGLIAPGVAGPIPNVARNQANLWTVYDFESGWKLGGGLNWTGPRFAGVDSLSAPGTRLTGKIGSYVTLDAMLAYPVTEKLSLALNGYNLANTHYYANSYFTTGAENHLVPGAGRTFLLTASYSL